MGGMRNGDFKYVSPKNVSMFDVPPNVLLSVSHLPMKGLPEDLVLEQIRRSAEDSLARYDTGHPTAKQGTIPCQVSLEAIRIAEGISNPNGIDGDMFRGSFHREREVVAMTSGLFDKSEGDPSGDAGFLLSGGTESLTQALAILRNRFFLSRDQDVRIKGLARCVCDMSEGKAKLLRPRILAPVNSHFSNVKCAELLGLGDDSVEYYGLDKNFDVDYDSLRETVARIFEEGDEIIANIACAGCTTKGKVHDVERIADVVADVSRAHDREPPPLIVDAAGSYLFLGIRQNSDRFVGTLPRITFKTEGVEAIIGDPHKQPVPYSCGMLLLRDWALTAFTNFDSLGRSYIDCMSPGIDDHDRREAFKRSAVALSSIPTSRSGSNALAIWAYYMHHGFEGIEENKRSIQDLTLRLAASIDASEYFDLIMPPETQVVPFKFRGSGSENKIIYERIKTGGDDFLYVSSDEGVSVRRPEELKQTRMEGYDQCFGGLFATIAEHNTLETVELLTTRLAEEAKRIIKER